MLDSATVKLAVTTETRPGERRVALVPDVVKKLVSAGWDVCVQSGAGTEAAFSDQAYTDAGATVAPDAAATLAGAGLVVRVNPPSAEDAAALPEGAALLSFFGVAQASDAVRALAAKKATVFSCDLLPRISRAQGMDALSSQATVSGYRAGLSAAEHLAKFFPMFMTAAGTVPPAKVLVVGAGVAGLQAIATARRLGAVVTATDVRPATKEQVESLGAKFLAVEDEEFKNAQTAGGYAKEMSKEYQAKQAALTAEHVKKQDVVITTALIPGRPAPRLVTAEMVKSMRPGSVLVDLAVERGGNVEGARPGEVADVDGIKIVGFTNVAGGVAASASSPYARNLFHFIETLVDKTSKALAVKG